VSTEAGQVHYLEAGDSLEDFLREFPSVSHAQAVGAMELAKKALLAEGDEAAA